MDLFIDLTIARDSWSDSFVLSGRGRGPSLALPRPSFVLFAVDAFGPVRCSVDLGR